MAKQPPRKKHLRPPNPHVTLRAKTEPDRKKKDAKEACRKRVEEEEE